MDAAQSSDPLSPPASTSTPPTTSPAPTTAKPRRNYRTKRGDDNDNSDHEGQVPLTTPSESTTQNPFIQSQNAQTIAEVYPGLSRLSFLDGSNEDETGLDPSGFKKSRRPLQQKVVPTASRQVDVEMASALDDQTNAPTTMAEPMATPASDSTPVKLESPPLTSPSSTSSGSTTRLVEIRETGSEVRGRGVFSVSTEPLKPGMLVFKELGFVQVVNDASLSKVCSACFKDTREDQGDEEGAGLAGSGVPKKLVRCAGCKVVWYCNRTCQVKDWKLHHQLECQGIQKSMTNSAMKEMWTKRTMDTTTVRALCRLIRRRERVKASAIYEAEHRKPDAARKQVNEVYVTSLDQKEEEWLDSNGSSWIDQYLYTYEQERVATAIASSKPALSESSQLAKIMAAVLSCVVTPKEDRGAFLKGISDDALDRAFQDPTGQGVDGSTGGLDLLRKLVSYGFTITNMETTMPVGLALYVQSMPYLNHSCVPNCIYTFRGSRVECRAIREIQSGEELTISYIDQIGTTRERQRQLQDQYHFTCDCPLCRYYPANPLASADGNALCKIYPVSPSLLDPKQGFICSNPKCTERNTIILATQAQIEVYNKVEAKCDACAHSLDLTLEMVQENQEDAERLIAAFMREMNGGEIPKEGAKKNARNFEVAKLVPTPAGADGVASVDAGESTSANRGGLKTVQEPSSRALQLFDEAYKILTGVLPPSAKKQSAPASMDDVEEEPRVRRSPQHHLVRQLEQNAFDEAVSHKHWLFALKRSIELEQILNATYLGDHPLKAIQSYYTCKIATLMANLLMEESSVVIRIDTDEEKEEEEDYDEEEEGEGDVGAGENSDDERDLEALRQAMGPKGLGTGPGSMLEQLKSGRKRSGSVDSVTAEKSDDETADTTVGAEEKALAQSNQALSKVVKTKNKKKKDRKGDSTKKKKKNQEPASKRMLHYLKTLVPRVDNPTLLQEYRACWGKDGKLPIRYRNQVYSFKQSLHYAEQPFVQESG